MTEAAESKTEDLAETDVPVSTQKNNMIEVSIVGVETVNLFHALECWRRNRDRKGDRMQYSRN